MTPSESSFSGGFPDSVVLSKDSQLVDNQQCRHLSPVQDASRNITPNYPTDLESDGARHSAGGPKLGSLVDLEFEARFSSGTNGDDSQDAHGIDDEDGIEMNERALVGSEHTFKVRIEGEGAILSAWIDWNRDADWDPIYEAILTDQELTPGEHNFFLTIPQSATPGVTFARFRVSTLSGLKPIGYAPDGEVEDYPLMIISNEMPIARPDLYHAVMNTPSTIQGQILLANDSDPVGDGLTISPVSEQSQKGGSLEFDRESFNYQGPIDFVGEDQFGYRITDSLGNSAEGIVTVRVSGTPRARLNEVEMGERPSGDTDDIGVTFGGEPNVTYEIQVSHDLVTWETIATITTGSNGVIEYLDVHAAELAQRFYRVVQVP